MRTKIHYPHFVLVFCIVLLTASCAWNGLIKTAQTKLLYDEFEAAALPVLDLPLSTDDMRIVENAIVELDSIRIRLGRIHDQSGGELVLTALQAEAYLEDIRNSYVAGREPIERYYRATGLVPPKIIAEYDHSASVVYAFMKARVSDPGVEVGEMTQLLGLILRIYANSNGVPL